MESRKKLIAVDYVYIMLHIYNNLIEIYFYFSFLNIFKYLKKK